MGGDIRYSMTRQTLSFKIARDLVFVNILSALLIAVIAFSPDSSVRILLGSPFILLFPGYTLICALFPREEDLDIVERLALCAGLSIAVTSLIGLALNYTAFGITLYSVAVSLFLFIFLMSLIAMYRRITIKQNEVFAPLTSANMSGWHELRGIKAVFTLFRDDNRIIKLIATIAFVLIALAAIIIKNTEYTGYETSIYKAIPILAWIFLIFGIICGICIVVYNVYTKEHEKNNKWVLGLLLILLSDVILLSLPILRGYAFWGRGDPFTHINTVLNIISSSHTETQLFYPIAPIYVTECYYIFGISVELLFKYVPLLFAILFVIYMYLFAKSVLPEKGQVILATVASTAFLHGWYISMTPNHLSNLMLPLVFFVFFKSYEQASHLKMEFRTLLIIMIFLYGAFHPVPAIALLILFIAIALFNKVYIDRDLKISRLNVTLILILVVWTITWISSFYVWDATIRNIHLLMTEGGPTAFSRLEDQMAYASEYGYSPFVIFIKYYNGVIVYFILALIAFFSLMKEMRKNKNLKTTYSLYSPLIIYFLITIALFATNLPFGPLRMMIYMIILCIVPVGFLLDRIIENTRYSTKERFFTPALAAVFVISILAFSSISGISTLYPSPYVLKPNDQFSYSELNGQGWFLDSRDTRTPLVALSFGGPLLRRGIRSKIPPYHFNYNNHTMLGESYTRSSYLTLNKQDRLLYTAVLPKIAEFRWYAKDFEKLEYDTSVDKLYTSGGCDIRRIHALGG